eukprot:5315519-Pyramimonas_sp.AAC.1
MTAAGLLWTPTAAARGMITVRLPASTASGPEGQAQGICLQGHGQNRRSGSKETDPPATASGIRPT